jgi:hypothetical protein
VTAEELRDFVLIHAELEPDDLLAVCTETVARIAGGERERWCFDLGEAPCNVAVWVACAWQGKPYIQTVVREGADGELWYPGTAYAWMVVPPLPELPPAPEASKR